MKRYVNSGSADYSPEFWGEVRKRAPEGYLYIFKHGVGPGTIPNDVKVIKWKDLPNYYTAVWLDRWLDNDELKQYDIPSETEINRYLDRIGYCKKDGDVVPCDDVEACDDIKATTDTSSIVNTIYSVMMNYEYGYDPDMTDINSMLQELTNKGVHVDTSNAFKKAWVSAHNKAERKTWGGSGDSMRYDDLTPRELDAIENYDTEYWEYVKDHPLNLKPASSTDITSSTDTKYFANMCNITGASGNLVYKNLGDVNFADFGRLVAKDPDRRSGYYVITCDPVYDTAEPTWSITQNYVDLEDDWFDVSEINSWCGGSLEEDPESLAFLIIDYYGSQNPYEDKLVSSAEGEAFLDGLNVADEVYWGASV